MIRNLTPHAITLCTIGACQTLDPEEVSARVSSTLIPQSSIQGLPITASFLGDVENLPPYKDGDLFIVSTMVLEAAGADRPDIMAPNELVRDHTGKVIGCRSFRRHNTWTKTTE